MVIGGIRVKEKLTAVIIGVGFISAGIIFAVSASTANHSTVLNSIMDIGFIGVGVVTLRIGLHPNKSKE
jgi:hypothetical protein